MSYERGCQEKTTPVRGCSEIFLCSQPLKLRCGLAVMAALGARPRIRLCSPILQLNGEFRVDGVVLLSQPELPLCIAELPHRAT